VYERETNSSKSGCSPADAADLLTSPVALLIPSPHVHGLCTHTPGPGNVGKCAQGAKAVRSSI
jgi:hypothetical protein